MAEMEEQAYEHFADSSSWASMDPELKEAACLGDVDFLKSAIASSKPAAYFLSRFMPPSDDNNGNDDDARCAGNIFHLAIWHERLEFVAVAMSMLPEKIIHLLLSQQETTGGRHWNPLHVAVWKENSSVVERIAKYCGNGEVFVAQDSQGMTPAFLAIETLDSESASILTTGSLAELIKNIGDHLGAMPLYWAVHNGLYNVVLNLLECQGTLCCSGPNGLTALHGMTGLASAPQDIQDEFFGKLLRRFPELITVTDNNGFTVLHQWADTSVKRGFRSRRSLRIFKYFFDHYPDVAAKLMLQTDSNGNNPLHVIAAGHPSSDDFATAVAEKLIDLYRECTAVLTTQTSQNHEWPWLMKNLDGETPLARAIHYRRWTLAWCFIRKQTPVDFLSIGDHKTYLMLPVQNGCSKFGPHILRTTMEEGTLDQMQLDETLHQVMAAETSGFGRIESLEISQIAFQNHYLILTFGDGSKILHLPSKSPEELIEKVLHNVPSLITQPDSRGVTPLDKASADGMESLL